MNTKKNKVFAGNWSGFSPKSGEELNLFRLIIQGLNLDRGHLNLDGGTLNLYGGTLTLDGGTRPPYNLSTVPPAVIDTSSKTAVIDTSSLIDTSSKTDLPHKNGTYSISYSNLISNSRWINLLTLHHFSQDIKLNFIFFAWLKIWEKTKITVWCTRRVNMQCSTIS